jgi:hypothetical protein
VRDFRSGAIVRLSRSTTSLQLRTPRTTKRRTFTGMAKTFEPGIRLPLLPADPVGLDAVALGLDGHPYLAARVSHRHAARRGPHASRRVAKNGSFR